MGMMIDQSGTVSDLADDTTWNEGGIHIRQRAQSVIVSLDFNRLTGPAIAAALYKLGDMEPDKICLAVNKNRITEVLIGFEPALRRICEILANADLR